MLRKIKMEKAILETVNGNEGIYFKADNKYLRVKDCMWRFLSYGNGYKFDEVTFYLEEEDKEIMEGENEI